MSCIANNRVIRKYNISIFPYIYIGIMHYYLSGHLFSGSSWGSEETSQNSYEHSTIHNVRPTTHYSSQDSMESQVSHATGISPCTIQNDNYQSVTPKAL